MALGLIDSDARTRGRTIEAQPEQKAVDSLWVTTGDLALLAGLSPQRVDQLRKQWGKPFERGKGPSLRIYAPDWLTQRREQTKVLEKKDSPTDELNHRKIEKLDIEIAKMNGELVLRTEVEEDLGSIATRISEGIELLDDHGRQVMLNKLDDLRSDFGEVKIHAGSRSKPSKNGKAKKPRPRSRSNRAKGGAKSS